MLLSSRALHSARRPTADMTRFLTLLSQRGISSATKWQPKRITNKRNSSSSAAAAVPPPTDSIQYASFAPLFSNGFVFENHQLTMLGDTIIDEYLGKVLLNHCLESGIVATTNTMKQWNAVLHNHFTLRMFAEELQFPELANPTDIVPASAIGEEGAAGCDLDLEPLQQGPSHSDVAGTSFDFAPLSCGHSSLGWKFSHMIGAVYHTYGSECAVSILRHMYDLESSTNLGWKAAQLLYRLVERYSPMNVAEALLAAQGIQATFVARTVFLAPKEENRVPPQEEDSGGEGAPHSAAGGEREEQAVSSSNPPPPSTSPMCSNEGVVATGGNTRRKHSSVTITGFGSPEEIALEKALRDAELRFGSASPVSGPGHMDAVGLWQRREIERAEGGSNAQVTLSEAIPSGWLTPEEHAKEKRGPAYSGFVDFKSCGEYFADAVGVPHPEDGKRIGRIQFSKSVRDSLFFDKSSDFRSGLPFDTNGLPVNQYLKQLSEPHERRFDVALMVNNNKTTVGRAISKRYTEARRGACQGYLMAVARDLENVSRLANKEA